MPNVWIYGQLPPQDNNDKNLRIQSPCPSNWSDDLGVVNDKNNEDKGQTDQPTDQPTVTGTRVPQDMLADASTTSQTAPNSASGIENTKNKITKLNRRPDCLMQPGHGKSPRNKTTQNENKENGRMENETSICLYRWVNLD